MLGARNVLERPLVAPVEALRLRFLGGSLMDESFALVARDAGALAGADSGASVDVSCLLSMEVRSDGCTVYEVVDALGATRWLQLDELPLEHLKAKAGEASWKCTSPSQAHGDMLVPCWSVSRMPRVCVCGAPSAQAACAKMSATRVRARDPLWVTREPRWSLRALEAGYLVRR